MQLVDGGDIPLGLPSTGTGSSNGNGSTTDAADDIQLSQDNVITDVGGTPNDTGAYASRAHAPTVNRLLSANGFDYSANALAGVPTFGGDSNYAFSTGLSQLTGFDNLTQPQVEVTPTSIANPANGEVFPASINFDSKTFSSTDGLFYADSTGRTIVRDTSNGADRYLIEPVVPDRSRYANSNMLVLGASVSLDFLSAFGGAKVLLPSSVLGANNQIVRTQNLPKTVAANLFSFFDDQDYAQFLASKNYTSFDNINNSVTEYLDGQILANLVDVSSGNGFTGGAIYSAATIRAGFGGAGDQNELGGRARDNFMYVEVIDPQSRRIVFATGDIGKDRTGGPSIDVFGLSRGLSSADEAQLTGAPTANLGFRAFLPASSLGSLAAASIVQTSLLVANPASGAQVSTSRLYHADLGLSADGKTSAISATFGAITYDDNGYPDRVPVYDDDQNIPPGKEIDPVDPRSKVSVAGSTIGSTRSGGTASTLFASPLAATAAGGGRDWQPGSGTQLRNGYAGYLVLENATDKQGGGVNAGSSSQLGASGGDAFGYLRLAAGYQSQTDSDTIANSTPTSGSLHDFAGYVAGAVEQVGTDGKIDAQPYLGTIALTLDPVVNTVSATIAYDDGAARSLDLGAKPSGAPGSRADERNAYIKAGIYGAAAESNGAKAAIIAGDGVKAGLGAAGAGIATYQHVQWGFFFGDLLPTGTGGGARRNHTALSSWVAGKRFTGANDRVGADSAMRGSVSFGGHAIGTVITQVGSSDPDIATRVGSFTQLWDLNARTGTMDLSFDGQQFNGTPLAVTGSTGLAYGGLSSLVNDRQAKISGELVNVPTLTALPGGTIGQFQIRGIDASYQANGTFGGDRTSP